MLRSLILGVEQEIKSGESLNQLIKKSLFDHTQTASIGINPLQTYNTAELRPIPLPNIPFTSSTRAAHTLRYKNLQPILSILIQRFRSGTKQESKLTIPQILNMDEFIIQHPSEVRDFRYELRSFVVHQGERTDSGHYYSYVLDSTTREWVVLDDGREPSIVDGDDVKRMKNDLSERSTVLIYHLLPI